MAFNVTTGKPTITHDPHAILDYGWDVAALIDPTDSVISATWDICITSPGGTVTTGADIVPGPIVDNTVWGWLSISDFSLVGQTVAGTCQFVTAQGRTDDRTLYFKIAYR